MQKQQIYSQHELLKTGLKIGIILRASASQNTLHIENKTIKPEGVYAW